MLYDIHRNMFKNKYTARPEDHHYSHGKPNTNRDPPVQGIADPLKVVTKLVTTSPEKCLKKQPKIDI